MAETGALEPAEWQLWDTYLTAHRLLVREVDRVLQRDCGISKAEFSVLVTLWRSPGHELRVGALVGSLDWEKSRVSHLLTRMENRGFVARTPRGAAGRRTGIELTAEGRRTVRGAIARHADTIRRCFLDPLTAEQAEVIQAWSEQLVERVQPGPGEGRPPAG
jgi:DNA-binding MarR family transcriptional regulator